MTDSLRMKREAKPRLCVGEDLCEDEIEAVTSMSCKNDLEGYFFIRWCGFGGRQTPRRCGNKLENHVGARTGASNHQPEKGKAFVYNLQWKNSLDIKMGRLRTRVLCLQ